MKITRLNQSHKEQLRNIYSVTYGEKEYIEKFYGLLRNSEYWGYNYGVVDRGMLLSVHGIIPVQVIIRNRRFSAYYLSNVCTLPSHRNQGHAKSLFCDAIERCQRENIPFVLFDPFCHSYYRKWGCELAMDANYFELDHDFLSSHYDSGGYTVNMGHVRNNKNLQDEYRKIRSEFWRNRLYNEMEIPGCYEEAWFYRSKKILAIVFDNLGDPQGYLRYSHKGTILDIADFRYMDLNAFYAMKRYILSYKNQVETLIFENIPPDFPVSLLVDDFWSAKKRIQLMITPYRMMRIVNVAYLLEKLNCKKICSPTSLSISDELLQKNQGTHRIDVHGKVSSNVVHTQEATICISDVVPLLTGRMSATELFNLGKLKVPGQVAKYRLSQDVPEAVRKLDTLFPKSITFSPEEL